MMERKGTELFFPILLACSLYFLAFGGCAPGHTRTETLLDTPEHHANTGFRLLDRDRVEDAEREFVLALHSDVSDVKAQCGIGLIHARRGAFSQALKCMALAEKNAKTEKDRAFIHVSYMRVYTMQKGAEWLGNVERNFLDAVGMAKDFPDAYFYLGVAHMEAFEFRKAEDDFNKVKALHAGLREEADRELETVSKIILARPGSAAGKKIAILKRMTRAETAALLVEELKLKEILKKGRAKTIGEPSKSSEEATGKKPFPLIPDWKNHPLEKDIDAILALDIEGLKRAPGGSFFPDQNITRAEYAMAVGDIMVKFKNNPTLATRFTGRDSPFSDVRNDEPYFTAVMLCTEGTGIMEPKSGVFNPAGGVAGADALLIIRRLKDELSIY